MFRRTIKYCRRGFESLPLRRLKLRVWTRPRSIWSIKDMSNKDAVLRFEKVHFSYSSIAPILDGANFVVRRGAKLTFMGQNGAGKSTIFNLITGEHEPEAGRVIRAPKATIAIARQVMTREHLDLTVREFRSEEHTSELQS